MIRLLVIAENAQGDAAAPRRGARHQRAVEEQPLAAAELAHRTCTAQRGRRARIAVLQSIGAGIDGIGNQSDHRGERADQAQARACPEKIRQKHESLLHR
ncbi:MAG: hypothetical protein ABWY30_08750 [Microterricola sp.]